jgi:Fic family protein
VLKLNGKYIEDILVRIAHHSSALENNTITLNETVSILLHNTIPGRGVSVREVYEITNHTEALEYVLKNLVVEFGINTVHDIHSILMDRLHHERGKFKTQQNAIVGAQFQTAIPSETPILMRQWVDNLKYRLETSKSDEEIIQCICESHIEFERIHPYADGNGRTGRLIMVYLLLKNKIPPLIIDKEHKANYITFLAEQDGKAFSDYAKKMIEGEKVRYLAFINSEPK